MSRIALSRKNPKAYAGNRFLLADIRAKLDSGLLESSVYYNWGKVWTPTNGPFEDPYRVAKKIRLPEDRLRYLFALAFPQEATKAHRLLPGESHWYEHPQDKWVEMQSQLIAQGMTEEQSWKEMLVLHRKKLQQAKLEQLYQLQQVQHEGGLPISKPPLETQLITKRYKDAYARRVTQYHEEARSEILQDAMQRLKEAERDQKPVRKIMVDEYPPNFPYDVVPSLVKDNPALRAAFDDMWYIGFSPLAQHLPLSTEQREDYDNFCKMIEKRAEDSKQAFTRNHLNAWKEQISVLRIPFHDSEVALVLEELDENFERNSTSVEDTVGGRIARLQQLAAEANGEELEELQAKLFTEVHIQEREDARTALEDLEKELDLLGGSASPPQE